MATIDQLLKAKSTEELEQMTDDELRKYFKDAISQEPRPTPAALIKAKLKEEEDKVSFDNNDDPCPIKERKKKDKKTTAQTISELQKELENL